MHHGNVMTLIIAVITHFSDTPPKLKKNKLYTRCTSVKCEFLTTDGASEQFVLLRFDAVSFCCAIDKCQTRTSDKLERCVHSVVLCSICQKLYQIKSICEQYQLVVFI